MECLISNIKSMCHSVQPIISFFNVQHVKDCIRLGKYTDTLSRPRPLLVKLNCASIAVEILKNHSTLPPSSNVFIKPHLSPSERLTESLLLKERRSLLDTGVNRKSIRLRGHKLYIGERLHGQVLDGVFVKGHTLGNKAPILNTVLTPVSSPPASTTTPSTPSDAASADASK